MTYNAQYQYDRYYASKAGSFGSIYDGMYGDLLIFRLRDALLEIAFQTAGHIQSKGGNTLRIVDFGCGNGRYFPVFEEIAAFLQERGMNLELTAYDISSVGLAHFKQHLEQAGFAVSGFNQEFQTHSEYSDGYIACNLQRDNITVRFAHGNVLKPIGDFADLIGRVDISAALFGVLGHIPGRENRQATLRMLGEISDYSVIATVANSRHVLHKERQFYDDLRAIRDGLKQLELPAPQGQSNHVDLYNMYGVAKPLHKLSSLIYGAKVPFDVILSCLSDPKERQLLAHWIETRLGAAKDAGDVYYERFEDGKPVVVNYYHMWSQQELKEDLAAAGLDLHQNKLRAEKLAPEGYLTRHERRNHLDGIAAQTVSGEGPIARLLEAPLHMANHWAERFMPKGESFSGRVRDALVSAFSHYFLVIADTKEHARSMNVSHSL